MKILRHMHPDGTSWSVKRIFFKNLFKSINNTFIRSLEKYQQEFIVNQDLNVHMFIDKLLIEIDINFDLLTDLNEYQHKNKLCVILYAYLIIQVYN